MALLPCWPEPNGSNASPTSVRCRWRTSIAMRSSVPPRMASAVSNSAWRARLTTCVGGRVGREAQRFAHERLDRWIDVGMRPHRPADLPDADRCACPLQALGVATQLGVPACGLEAEGDRLRMHAMG